MLRRNVTFICLLALVTEFTVIHFTNKFDSDPGNEHSRSVVAIETVAHATCRVDVQLCASREWTRTAHFRHECRRGRGHAENIR
jgi:hypothetical protein